nr:UAP56-interacting factor-like isoform X2 [Caretta caretta]
MEPAGPEPGAGAGPERGAEEIDMSLDDIIKRHRKGQTGAKLVGDKRRQQVKNRNSAYGNGRPRFRTWMQRNLQGPSQFRRGFGQQQYNRRQFRSAMAGPRRVAATLNGASPLNHQALAQEGNQNDEVLTKADSGQPEAQRRLPQRPKRFRTAGVTGEAPSRRPFTLNRRPAFQQRQSKVSFTRGQTEPHAEGKRPRTRRWHLQPSSGAVLTISVSNPQASHIRLPGSKRPFLRGRRPPPRTAKAQPRGVPLRFNFRAMANQVERMAQVCECSDQLDTPCSALHGCRAQLSCDHSDFQNNPFQFGFKTPFCLNFTISILCFKK